MACGDVLSLEDLQTAKKHQIFEAEVITGKAGGVAGGATIGTATNPVTGQTQQTLPSILADLGFDVQPWTSSTGGVLASANQVFLNDTPGSLGLGDYYAWSGPFPKTVPAGTNPALPTSGYIMRSSRFAGVQAREALRRSYAEAGYNLVAGSFEAGGAVTTATEVLLYEANGKAYSWGGVLPKTVPSGSTPTSAGGVSPSAWTDRSSDTTVSTQKSIRDFANTDALLADGSAALQSLFNYCSTNGVKGVVDVPVNCNNVTLTIASNADISFVGSGKLINGSINIAGTLGAEIGLTAPAARGQSIINAPGSSFAVGDLIYIKSCINCLSTDAGDDQLGSRSDKSYFAEFATVISTTASTITVDSTLIFPYSTTPGPNSGPRTNSTVAKVNAAKNIRINNLVMQDKASGATQQIIVTFGQDVDIDGAKLTYSTVGVAEQSCVIFDRSFNCVGRNVEVGRPATGAVSATHNSLLTRGAQGCGFENVRVIGGAQSIDFTYWPDAARGAPSVSCFVSNAYVYGAKAGPTSHPGNYSINMTDIKCAACEEGVRLRSIGDSLQGFRINRYAGNASIPAPVGGFGVLVSEGYNAGTVVNGGVVSGYQYGVQISLNDGTTTPSPVAGRVHVSNASVVNCASGLAIPPQLANNIDRPIVVSNLVSIGCLTNGISVGSYNNGVTIDGFTAVGPFGASARAGLEYSANIANLTIKNVVFSGLGAVFGLRGPSTANFMTDVGTFPGGNADAHLFIGSITYVGQNPGTEDSGIIRDLSAFNSSLNGYTNGYVIGSNRVRQQNGQTADVQEWQNSSGSKVLGVSTVGKLSGSQATVVKNAITAATDVATLKTALLNLFA